MRILILILILSLINSLSAQSLEKTISETVAPATSCESCKKVSCLKLVEQGCAEFNNAKRNIKVENGQFLMGESEKSSISQVNLIDKKALIDSFQRMPPLMQKHLKAPIEKLSELLKVEIDEQPWYRKLSHNSRELEDAFEEYVDEEFNLENPPHRADHYDKLPIEMKRKYLQLSNEKHELLFKLKYQQSSQWQRVERLFPVAKKQLIETINELNIAPDLKKKMQDKVQSVELFTPDDRDCQTNTKNAFYLSSRNKFTVCAGYINSLQTDASMFLVIAHELTHSIDPTSIDYSKKPWWSFAHFKNGSPLMCDELKKFESNPLETFENNNYLNSFQDCLRNNNTLAKFDPKIIEHKCDENADAIIDTLATNGDIEKLFNDDNKEMYMMPDYILYILGSAEKEPTNLDWLAHIHSCENDVKSSIIRFKKISRKLCTYVQMKQGKNGTFAVTASMGKDITEDFADWFAYKSFPKFLTTQKNIQNEVKFAQADFCPEKVNPKLDALKAIIKQFSTEEHPGNSKRIIQFFTPEVAKLADCEIDLNAYLDCHP